MLQTGAMLSVREMLLTTQLSTAPAAWIGVFFFTLLLFLMALLQADRWLYGLLFLCQGFVLGYVFNCVYAVGGYAQLLKLLCALGFRLAFLLPAQLYAACVFYGCTDKRMRTPPHNKAFCVYLWALSATMAGETFISPLVERLL